LNAVGAPSVTASPYRIRLAAAVLRRLIQQGVLRVSVGDDALFAVTGARPGPNVGIRFSDWRTLAGCAIDPDLKVGEAYMDGTLTIESGTLADFLHLAVLNTDAAEGASGRILKFLRAIRSVLVRLNPARTARRFVAHHYDLEDQLFELFLDRDLQYSCAYFSTPEDDLETAQARKKLRLAAKLLLQPGQRVLDIGSGWGGLAMDLARLENVDVDGVTLSRHQHRASVQRASSAGLSDRVRFELKDYRAVDRTYDRIISVGMLEHVGRHNLNAFFKKVAELLTHDGVAVVHAIGSFRDPGPRQPWIERYIFPGSFLPPLDLVFKAIQRTPLIVTDVEILRYHYAETLKAWRQRFHANAEGIRALYDERFVRMWDMYLTGCEMVFRAGQAMVFQIQLARSPATVPMTRSYIDEFQRVHEAKRRT
jgi:cyclopropane-fatty-acyl-phospholipid synthase